MNPGKIFENEIKNSVPDNVFYYRFRDGTGNFNGGKNENVRFQQSNMCDCMLYHDKLYLLELKSHAGKSLPLSAIRDNQLDELHKASTYDNIIAGFLINFRDVEKTYFCKAVDVLYFKAHEERKSIPLSWCEQWGTEIDGRKLRVHYKWDLDNWLNVKKEG